MLAATILSLLSAAAIANAQSSSVVANAPVATGNPRSALYMATLPDKATTNVRGAVIGTSSPDGRGVTFSVAISGLPETGGPFMYHIHEKPVPEDGNCTGTGAHLDPFKRGEVPACDSTKPETCQVGDLSGKHGNLTEVKSSFQYTDLYLSTDPSSPQFFGKLSVVVHTSNKTRISCANFVAQSPGIPASVPLGTASSGYAHPTGTGVPTHSNNTLTLSPTATGTGSEHSGAGEPSATPPSPTKPLPTGSSGAHKLAAGSMAVIAALVALML